MMSADPVAPPAEPVATALPAVMPSEAAPGHRVLVVEDSRSTREMLASLITELGGLVVDAVASLRDAEQALAAHPEGYLCAVLDLNLPDAPHGQIVDAVLAHGTPTIVLSVGYSEPARRTLLKRGVVDCVLKRNPADLRHVAGLVRRVRDNPAFVVMVVDASPVSREATAALLHRLSYRTVAAGNGVEALAQWAAHPDLSLVITDIAMPVMDGFELISAIRQRAGREELPIIGVSDRSRTDLSTRLLKSGANDFLHKPFEVEEFSCRVTQNIDLIGYIRRVRDASPRDALTDLWNRRHLFETGDALFRRASVEQGKLAVALVDIVDLERINDLHGRGVGDDVLKRIAACIAGAMRPNDLAARCGGARFACVLNGAGPADALMAIDRLRAKVEALDFFAQGARPGLRVRCGVAHHLGLSFESMMQTAELALHSAGEGAEPLFDADGAAARG